MENIVFYFSGTGNSLKVAKTIAEKLGSCKIVSMAKSGECVLEGSYNTIGFVYPAYCWGLPKKVAEFAGNIKLDNNKTAYYYSVTTYGGIVGNGISSIKELLYAKHNIALNYGTKLKMVGNHIFTYNISKKIEKKLKSAEKNLEKIIDDIRSRKNNNVKKSGRIFNKLYKMAMSGVSSMAKDYNVNENCTNCGICVKLCPVKNIDIVNGKHIFKNNCEQCLSCIHYCPQKAINYKNSTQKRRRYNNPDIDYNELIKYNNM